MKLQHVSVKQPAPELLGESQKAVEILAVESQAAREKAAAEQHEREEFVERIEAFCDCV